MNIFFSYHVDNVRFALDQHAKFYFYSTSPLQQQFADKHVAPLGHNIQIPSQTCRSTRTQYSDSESNMSLHSDTIFWFRVKHVAPLGHNILIPSQTCRSTRTQYSDSESISRYSYSLVTRAFPRRSNTYQSFSCSNQRSTTVEASTLTIAPFVLNWSSNSFCFNYWYNMWNGCLTFSYGLELIKIIQLRTNGIH